MNNVRNSNETTAKKGKITLKDYYRGLPKSISPKTEFINQIMDECKVTIATARNWALYGIRPKREEHVRILARITGIPEDELFD